MSSGNDKMKKGFLPMDTMMTSKGPYVVLEGIVAGEAPVYRASTSDKKSVMHMRLLVGRNAWDIFKGDPVADAQPETTFVSVTAFDRVADSLNGKLAKHSKVAICGRATIREYEKKDKSGKGYSVEILANNAYPIACKATAAGEPNRSVCVVNNTFTMRDNTTGTSRVTCLIPAVVKNPGESRTTESGRTVRDFDVELATMPASMLMAMSEGKYNKNKNYGKYKKMRVSVWGNHAENMSRVLTPGNTILLTGILYEREYNGNTFVNMTLRDMSVMEWAENASVTEEDTNGTSFAPPAEDWVDSRIGYEYADFEEDDDGDLPF